MLNLYLSSQAHEGGTKVSQPTEENTWGVPATQKQTKDHMIPNEYQRHNQSIETKT